MPPPPTRHVSGGHSSAPRARLKSASLRAPSPDSPAAQYAKPHRSAAGPAGRLPPHRPSSHCSPGPAAPIKPLRSSLPRNNRERERKKTKKERKKKKELKNWADNVTYSWEKRQARPASALRAPTKWRRRPKAERCFSTARPAPGSAAHWRHTHSGGRGLRGGGGRSAPLSASVMAGSVRAGVGLCGVALSLPLQGSPEELRSQIRVEVQRPLSAPSITSRSGASPPPESCCTPADVAAKRFGARWFPPLHLASLWLLRFKAAQVGSIRAFPECRSCGYQTFCPSQQAAASPRWCRIGLTPQHWCSWEESRGHSQPRGAGMAEVGPGCCAAAMGCPQSAALRNCASRTVRGFKESKPWINAVYSGQMWLQTPLAQKRFVSPEERRYKLGEAASDRQPSNS